MSSDLYQQVQQLESSLDSLMKEVRDLAVKMNDQRFSNKTIVKDSLRIAPKGKFIIEEQSATPATATAMTGELVVVSGDLYIFNGTSWEKVGVQT